MRYFVIILAVISSINLYSADNDSLKLRPIGIGLQVSDLSSINGSTIALSINATNHIRIEPTYSYAKNNSHLDINDKESFEFGLGIFGMNQYHKTNIYGGVRVEYGELTYCKEEYQITGISQEYPNAYYYATEICDYVEKKLKIGPALGAEYYFNEHFCFGGEVGLKYLKTIEGGSYDEKETVFTDSKLTIHFYF